jgi:hypothetical protein
MKKLILAAIAALTLTAGGAPLASAYAAGFANNAYQSGQYDNFNYGPGDLGAARGS